MNARLSHRLPSPDEFWSLKNSSGENHYILQDSVAKALEASLFGMVAEVDNAVIGIGRFVGDGAMLDVYKET